MFKRPYSWWYTIATILKYFSELISSFSLRTLTFHANMSFVRCGWVLREIKPFSSHGGNILEERDILVPVNYCNVISTSRMCLFLIYTSIGSLSDVRDKRNVLRFCNVPIEDEIKCQATKESSPYPWHISRLMSWRFLIRAWMYIYMLLILLLVSVCNFNFSILYPLGENKRI